MEKNDPSGALDTNESVNLMLQFQKKVIKRQDEHIKFLRECIESRNKWYKRLRIVIFFMSICLLINIANNLWFIINKCFF